MQVDATPLFEIALSRTLFMALLLCIGNNGWHLSWRRGAGRTEGPADAPGRPESSRHREESTW